MKILNDLKCWWRGHGWYYFDNLSHPDAGHFVFECWRCGIHRKGLNKKSPPGLWPSEVIFKRDMEVKMNEGELLSKMGMNADLWAEEFMDIFKNRKEDIDVNLMRTWFASAIMCGWDHHYWSTDEYKEKIKKFI